MSDCFDELESGFWGRKFLILAAKVSIGLKIDEAFSKFVLQGLEGVWITMCQNDLELGCPGSVLLVHIAQRAL